MKRFGRLTIVGGLLIGLASLLLGAAPTQDEKAPPKYVGVSSCKKCHQKGSIGKQYKLWEASAHAKAYELLLTDEAKAVATKAGVTAAPNEAPECLSCHTTGYGLPVKTHYGDKFKKEDGVTCEACHGQGEFFDKPKDEKHHAEAVDKGYIKAVEAVCLGCHNDKSPTWNPEADTTEDGKKVGFDYKSRLKTIAHPIPKEDK